MIERIVSNRRGGLLRPAMVLWALLSILWLPGHAFAETEGTAEPIPVPNPGADLWRDVRQRQGPVVGESRSPAVESGVLINTSGERWRQFRSHWLVPIAGYVLGGTLAFITLFYLIRGRVPLKAEKSGKKLLRYTSYERVIHWFNAAVFLFLAITGLILLFGRPVLIPLMGKEAFAVLASASKEGHNLFGPLFLIALTLVFIQFVRRNIYQRGDLTWLLKGGGIIGKKHVPSNFFNMGEKSMFWLLVLVGLVIIASGFVLVFPVFGQGREIMELSHVAHTLGAVLLLVVILGHMYIGSIGMEGALEPMKNGYCDLNWGLTHHDWWAEKCQERGEVLSPEEVAVHTAEKPGASGGPVTPAEEAGK